MSGNPASASSSDRTLSAQTLVYHKPVREQRREEATCEIANAPKFLENRGKQNL